MANVKKEELTKGLDELVTEMKVKLTFLEPILGTTSNNPEIAREFIASKAPTLEMEDEEVEAIDPQDEYDKGLTVFPRDSEDRPFLWDYQIKGFFKDTCGGLKSVKGSQSSKIKNHKKMIDKEVFIKERQIPIIFDGDITICERPLRAQTPKGERVALAYSEQIPAGAQMEFTIKWFPDAKVDLMDLIYEWLDYGEYSGIGQWRNSGKGRFTWEETEKVK